MTNNSKATSNKDKKPKTFELPKRIDLPNQTDSFLHAYPDLRCLVDYVGNFFKQQLEQLSAPIPQAKPALVYSKKL